jgi:hypothetical protein
MRPTAAFALLSLLILSPACDGDPADKPYIEFAGGGFVFNYRLAEVTYGFVAKRVRKIPPGTLLEAHFEDPAGGPAIVVTDPAREGALQYSIQTPPVQGVEAEKDYGVELKLLAETDGTLLASYSFTIRSELGQDILPDRPLTVGPGYEANPERVPAEPNSSQ